jgi:hypothetical protein
MPGKKVGNLDIQFGDAWDKVKGNQLVQSLQQVIGAVNLLANQTSSTTPVGVAVHELADQTGLGPDHTVAGLQAGQVLIAESPTTAHFGFLTFAQIADTDPGTFAAPVNGDVITFVNGYWSAEPLATGLGLSNPGNDALIMWDPLANGGAGGLRWAIAGNGITLMSGSIAVNDHQLNHSNLLNLLADDHPQYALVGAPNTFSGLQTFSSGLVSGSDIDLTGNLEQFGPEGVEDRIQNVNDITDEGTWRLHVEPGQEMWASVADPDPGYTIGSDGENWLYVQRIAEVVDTVGISANNFTYNGLDVMVAYPLGGSSNPYLQVMAGGQLYELQLASAVGTGGGSLSVTDGTHTVAGTTSLTFSGATVSGSTPNATVTIAAASPALPGTIPDLMLWWESDDILGAAGTAISRMRERTPWIGGLAFAASSGDGAGVVIDSNKINGLVALKWPGTLAGRYAIPAPVSATNSIGSGGFWFSGNAGTFFIVANPNTSAATQAITGGNTGALSLYLVSVGGTAKIGLVKTGAAVIGSSSTAWVSGTPFQANVTYNATSGAYVFRQGRAAAGSGTGTTGAGNTSGEYTDLIGADVSNSSPLNGSIAALIVYNRILTNTEITNVENYLNAKWGV